MSEEKVSNKFDVEARQANNNNQPDNRESYKQISEDIGLDHVSGDTVKNSNMVRENGDSADGADEKMLGSDDKETLALKSIEVKFIPSDPNGDAKIEIGSAEKTFTGMTKEELMKYANDPFWIKLRWFLFILFWLAWIGMLVGAVAIIFFAPKCAAPTPLSWYKKSPLALINGVVDDATIEKMKKFDIQGVVYELPGHETYKVSSGDVHDRIKGIVEKFKAKDIHVVIDLTPNYVTTDDQLFIDATKETPDEDSLKAFVISDKSLNWKKVKSEESAWKKVGTGTNHFLSQFNDTYDIRLNQPIVEEKLKNVITSLASIGVKGFRLVNAKYFIIEDSNFADEKPSSENTQNYNMNQYEFYQHTQTTYREGLGKLLQVFNSHVKNVTNDEGFLTIRDDISGHADVFRNNDYYGFELPRIGFVNTLLHSPDAKTAENLHLNFERVNEVVKFNSIWAQIQYSKETYAHIEESAFKLFVSFLRAVQIASVDDLVYIGNSSAVYEKIKDERTSRSAVFEHGDLKFYLSNSKDAFAYSRVKAGNPGIFLVINPLNDAVKANFSTSFTGSDLSFVMGSLNFGNNATKVKVSPHKIELPKQSAAVFTFVP